MYIITDSAITLFVDGQPNTFDRSNINPDTWADVLDRLKRCEWDEALDLLTSKKLVEAFTAHHGRISVHDGQVWYDSTPIDNYATQKLIQFAREGLPIEPLLGFLNRVMKNPSYRAVQGLYQFLEAGRLPLTIEGTFLAYKKVRRLEDGRLVDIYTKTMDNSPGTVVSMPRNMVDEDPDRTCSAGLHVCSPSYLPHFGSAEWDVVVLVEVDPEHVVAVPRDYNNAKMRCCEYKVLRETEYAEHNRFEASDLWSGDEDYCWNEDDGWMKCEDDGWIKWDGNTDTTGGPVGLDAGAKIQVRFRGGNATDIRRAGAFSWTHRGYPSDIVAYRIID